MAEAGLRRDPDAAVRRGAAVPPHPVVSVVVLILDSSADALRCLDSVRAEVRDGEPVEIVVVANGTPEDELTPLLPMDDIVLVRSLVNNGFGGGCGIGAAVARGEYLLFLNDDARLRPGCLAALLSAARDPQVGIAAAMLVDERGQIAENGRVLWGHGQSDPVDRGRRRPSRGGVHDVDCASACAWVVPAAVWLAAAGMDERYFPAYFEDIDLCLRVQQMGLRVVVVTDAVAEHRGNSSTSSAYRAWLIRRNQRRFRERWAAILRRLPQRPAGGNGADAAGMSASALLRAETPLRDRPACVAGATPAFDGAALLAIEAVSRRRLRDLTEELAAGPATLHEAAVMFFGVVRDRLPFGGGVLTRVARSVVRALRRLRG